VARRRRWSAGLAGVEVVAVAFGVAVRAEAERGRHLVEIAGGDEVAMTPACELRRIPRHLLPALGALDGDAN
jgi:hypothetical protein